MTTIASPATSTATTPAVPTTGISTDSSRLSSHANLKKAGDDFEAVFVGMMLKSMRKAKLSDTLFESKGLDTFRDMQDQKTAAAMAQSAPLGIGKAMVDFLSKAQAAAEASAAAQTPAAEGGKT